MIGFVTGLPRSRSAWFATLLTWGDSIWKHDALYCDNGFNQELSLKRLVEWLKTAPHRFRGHSDSSNLLVWECLAANFNESKWVYIDRPRRDVCSSVEAITHTDPGKIGLNLREMQDEAESMCAKTKAMIVHFDVIDPIKCYEIAEYLGIDIGPATRVRQICDMNIQIHPPILKRRLAQLKSQLVVDSERAA